MEISKANTFIAKIGTGSYFGESVFAKEEATRSATVIAISEVECLSIEKQVINAIFCEDMQFVINKSKLKKLIKGSEHLRQFKDDQLETLMGMVKITTYQEPSVLFNKSEKIRKLVLVLQGKVTNVLYRSKKIFGDYSLGNEINEYHYYESIYMSSNSIVAEIEFQMIHSKFGINLKRLFHENKIYREVFQRYKKSIGKLSKFSLKSYKFVKILGIGGFGAVFLVTDLKNFFALKVIRKKSIQTKLDLRFLNYEKNILHYIDFPFIMSLKQISKDKNYFFFVNQYIRGCQFEEVLIELDLLDASQTRFYISQIGKWFVSLIVTSLIVISSICSMKFLIISVDVGVSSSTWNCLQGLEA